MLYGKDESAGEGRVVSLNATMRREETANKRVAASANGDLARAKRRPEDLTPREFEILQLVWAGFTNRNISEKLHISIKTAEAHRSNMMKKLRVSNTAQLLKVALEGGIIQPDGKVR